MERLLCIFSLALIPMLALGDVAEEELMERNGVMYHINADPPYALFDGSASAVSYSHLTLPTIYSV